MGTWLKQLLLFCVRHHVLSVQGLSSQAEGGGQAGFPARKFQKLLLETAPWYVVPQPPGARSLGKGCLRESTSAGSASLRPSPSFIYEVLLSAPKYPTRSQPC